MLSLRRSSLVLDAGAKQVVLSHEVPLVSSAQFEEQLGSDLFKTNPDKLYIVEPANMGEGWSEGRSIAGNIVRFEHDPCARSAIRQILGRR